MTTSNGHPPAAGPAETTSAERLAVLTAERDKLIDRLVFYLPIHNDDWEEGDHEWRAILNLPYEPEFRDCETKAGAVAAVRREYGLDPASAPTPAEPPP